MAKQLRVLIVEDSPDDAELTKVQLSDSYDCSWEVVETAADYAHALARGGWDVILCDHNLPAFDSIKALRLLQDHREDIPFIIVSGAIGEVVAVAAMKMGASDYVMKGNLARLVPVIERETREAAVRREKRRADEESKRLTAIIEATPDLVAITDPQGLPVYINAAGSKLLGVAEGHGAAGLERNAPYIAHRVIRGEALARAAAEGKFTEETLLVTHDGREIPVSQVTLAHRGEDGEVEFFSVIARDITQTKESEEALRLADRRKDEFLATLAHELRNPLAPLANAASLMGMLGHDPAELAELREIIGRQVQHMVRLIDDLLDVSRITRGKIELRRERVSLHTVLDAAIEAAQPLIDEGGYTLTRAYGHEDLVLDADPARLTQIFANLLNNAIKYTPAGGRIAVSTKRQGDHAEASVQDDGIGIPRDMLHDVFDMFTQIGRTLAGRQSGLGVGLTLAKSLVEMHNGQIEAHSAGTNRGSEFIVRLPLARSTATGASNGPAGTAAEPEEGCRVLVVDDTALAADLFAKLLRAKGHDARAVYGGEEALETLRTYHPDVVFSDIAMPGISGYEFAAEIKSRPDLATIVLVAMSGYGQAEDKRRSAEAGFDFHLTKPVEFNSLDPIFEAAKARRT
ncbi:MAG: response regulator [Dehalococcoidia bacterium]